VSKPAAQHSLELLSHLSLRSLYRVADAMALVLQYSSNRATRQARQNIAACFPELDSRARKALYKEVIRNTCRALFELPALWCWPPDRVMERVSRVEVCDEFQQSTRGRIILAPHIGAWEVLSVWLGKTVSDPMYLYKRRRNRDFDEFIKQARARTGGVPVSTKKSGLRQLLVGLKKGGCVTILPDQKPSFKKVRIESSFFGLSAPTTTLVHTLCSKIDCDVFTATVIRSSPPGDFSLSIQPLEHARLGADKIESAQYMNDEIEKLARRHLEQYQWTYRRFSSRVYESL
jgi:Kdo2-lipid IVA lauroyltransferase/acyltransferase